MLRDAAGNRLFRRVEITIIFPENIFPPKRVVQRAGPHQGFGPNGIDDILMSMADQLETLYPFWEFQASELAPEHRTARWVLTFAGYRTGKVSPITESKAPGTETAESTTPAEAGTLTAVPAVLELGDQS